jgi:chromosome segregation ATPase
MLNPWLILGTIAFIGSFGVSLLMTSDFGASLVAGSAALVTAFGTAAAVNWYRNQSTDQRMLALRHQIRGLQRQRAAEEQAVIDLSAEKERVIAALQSMQETLRQRQLPSANPYAPPAVSWNLATPPSPEMMQAAIAETTAEVQSEFQPASLTQFISEAAATKQKIMSSLNQLQGELNQVNGQVSDQRQVRDQLIQDVQHLKQQKQHLNATAKTLTQEVQELDRCRQELDEYVLLLETKKQELETGANPLQKALKQLQSQVTALQEELRSLEGQVTAKRHEKATLEQAIHQTQTAPQPKRDAVRHLEQQKAHLERELFTLQQQQEQQKAHLERELFTLQQQQEQAIALQQLLPQLEQQKALLEADLTQIHQQQQQAQILRTELAQLQQQKVQLEQDLNQLKQQQSQVQSAQDTLQKVENQIRDRRQEKESLEKQITQLQAQKTALRTQPTPAPTPVVQQQLELAPRKSGSNGHNGTHKPVPDRPVTRPKAKPIADSPWDTEDPDDELPDLWTEFMVQLPEYELQALKAIAHEPNPTRALNQIAADNFTTPEELTDAINQLSKEIVGQQVIKFRGPSTPPIIVKDHQRTIKKLIETYEYLTE